MIDSEIIEKIETQLKLDFKSIKTALTRELNNNGKTNKSKFSRIEISIPEIDIIKWLDQQPATEKIYWSERSGEFEVGGIGIAHEIKAEDFSDYQQLISYINANVDESNPFLRYYGGFQFNQNEPADNLWQNFGNYYFVLPQFEIFRNEDDYYFAINFSTDTPIDKIQTLLQTVEQIHYNQNSVLPPSQEIPHRDDYPNKDGWTQIINTALKKINQGIVNKVVLARRVILKFQNPLNTFSLLHRLKKINPFATHFCFQIKNHLAFLGGTPELLYRRKNGSIYSEAIAGTRPRGKNEIEDSILERELLDSDKERREHAFVIESIKESLNLLCKEVVSSKELSVIKLRRLQHLYSKFHGKLKEHVSDVEILSLLHPTPAVGGYPGKKALEQLKNLEPFQRGWYAAPVGWMGYKSAEFAVAIRSGLIKDNILALYSGCGIVDGSDVNSEWQEIENKIGNFLKALGINGDQNSQT